MIYRLIFILLFCTAPLLTWAQANPTNAPSASDELKAAPPKAQDARQQVRPHKSPPRPSDWDTEENSFSQDVSQWSDGWDDSDSDNDPRLSNYKWPPRQRDDIRLWYRNRVSSLERFKEEARSHYSVLQYSLAYQTLKAGLMTASEEDVYYQGALTSKAIARGKRFVLALEKCESLKKDRAVIKSLTFFLFKYYDFIADVSKNLDEPYYSPMPGGRYGDRVNDMDFERAYVELAQKQLRMMLEDLVTVEGEGDRIVVYPLGEPAIFLNAMELTTKAVAQDLRDSYFATRYAHSIEELKWLHYKLYRFNHPGQPIEGNRYLGTYPNAYIAVNSAYAHAANLIGFCPKPLRSPQRFIPFGPRDGGGPSTCLLYTSPSPRD